MGETSFGNYVATHIFLIAAIALSFVIWLVVNNFWPGFYDPFAFWLMTDNIPYAVLQSWPFFLYAAIVAIIVCYFQKDPNRNKGTVLAQGIYKSIMAGILEEVGFRNMFIFIAMVSLTIINTISFGLMLWLYEFITIPITNLITIGLMQNILYGFPLILIAGALSANAAFRDGHKYQGGFGYINS